MSAEGNALLGTPRPAPRQAEMFLASWQSADYVNMMPYPRWAFGVGQWDLDKGPRPTALPYAKILTTDGAEFVFRGGPPQFSVPENPAAEDLIRSVIQWNQLDAQWIGLAESLASQGVLAVRFHVDMNRAECPIRLTFYNVPQECRFWADPHDITRMLMVRVQYPYRSLEDGSWYFFREEWTDDTYRLYRPLPAGAREVPNAFGIQGYVTHLGDESGTWDVEREEENPYGVIPISIIRNRWVQGNPMGEGDLWRTFRLIDRIALALHGEDRQSQQNTDPVIAAINAQFDHEGGLMPGEVVSIESDHPSKNADIKMLEPHGRTREWSHRTIDRWEDLLWRDAGLTHASVEQVSNMGQLSALALKLMFQRSISTSDRKRENWGNGGMCPFFQRLLVGLCNLGGAPEARGCDFDTEIAVRWGEYFSATAADLTDVTNRQARQVEEGFTTQEQAIRTVQNAERMPEREIEQLLKDLAIGFEKKRQRMFADQVVGESLKIAVSQDRSELANIAAAIGSSNFQS